MATEDTCQRKTSKLPGGAEPPERLPCPRCTSANTKFCYYNNYNLSQPRHFCKSCRRYWTHGGTLRDIPVGGATRRNAKRCRTMTPAAAPFPPAQQGGFQHVSGAASGRLLAPLGAGSFTFLLNGSPASGIQGFGMGRDLWPFCDVAEGGPTSVNGGGGQTWQMESGDGGFVGDGGCFGWPDLGISTPEERFEMRL